MELKVWCEGIQRVICGVTEGTTCHDVVVALAQAMGKTGRYTLVEKWRETERLVSPEEYPLTILHTWGEYANDVQFILRHSGGCDRKGSAGHQGDKSGSDSQRTNKLSYHNFSPHLSESRSSSMSSLKKSLTFSGAHSHSVVAPRTDSRTSIRGQSSLPENSSLESLTEQSSQSSYSNFANSSAHSSLEQRRRTRLQDSLSSQSSASSLDPRNRSNVFPSTQGHRNGPHSSTFGGSLDRTRKRNQNKPQNTSSSSQHLANSTTSHPNGHIQPPRNRPSPPSTRLPKESNNNTDYKPNANLKYQISESDEQKLDPSSTKSPDRDRNEEEEKKKSDLVKVVNLQTDKIQRQQVDMTEMDKEISFREESEKKHKEDESRILEEIALLEKQEVELDSELQDLELVSWEDKLDMEQEKERRIRVEIQNINSKIQECREEINKQEGLVKMMSEDLGREKEARSKEEKQRKEEELKTLQEISELQKQINTHLKKHEEQNTSIEELQAEVKGLESKILERKTQIGDLERDLKDSNMERFTRSPADWIHGSHEGRSPFIRSSSTSRPASARRLESPQRLKETVATPRNPHGLWV